MASFYIGTFSHEQLECPHIVWQIVRKLLASDREFKKQCMMWIGQHPLGNESYFANWLRVPQNQRSITVCMSHFLKSLYPSGKSTRSVIPQYHTTLELQIKGFSSQPSIRLAQLTLLDIRDSKDTISDLICYGLMEKDINRPQTDFVAICNGHQLDPNMTIPNFVKLLSDMTDRSIMADFYVCSADFWNELKTSHSKMCCVIL